MDLELQKHISWYIHFMIGWDACILEPNGALRWIECHPATAAWAQAIGIVITIAATAFFTRWSVQQVERRIRSEKSERASVIAARLAPVVYELRVACDRVRNFIAATASGFDMVHDLKSAENALRIHIFLPEDVLPQLDATSAKDAGIIAALYNALGRYNSFVAAEVHKMRMMSGDERAAYSEHLESHLSSVSVMAAATDRALSALLPK